MVLHGDDMLLLEGSERFVAVNGVGGHCDNQFSIVTACNLMSDHKGDVIAIFRQAAFLGTGKSILSCLHMEHYGAESNDKFPRVSGCKQTILMNGYQTPFAFNNGLLSVSADIQQLMK
jgi:hypothetical protein